MTRSLRLIALALLCAALLVVPASAKKSTFKTGTYTATGGVAFKFKIYKGFCYDAKGKKKEGFCFSGLGTPQVKLDCPEVEDGPKDREGLAFLPNQKLLSSTGKIRIKFRNPVRTGEYDDHTFNLDLGKKGRGSGSLSLESTVKSIAVTSTCKSGKLAFSAKK
ncbi:MAG: hypothetical protein JHD02_04895 [Thermoleophilaceae bacterium]|nr:hypothetical protein [Thermoleophilaceae bacterium]